MSPLKLPPVDVPLPAAWDRHADEDWTRLRQGAEALFERAFVGVPVLDEVDRIRALLTRDARDEVLAALTTGKGAGALSWLWCETEGEWRDSIAGDFVEAIDINHPRPSRLIVDRLERTYFERYDALEALGDGVMTRIAQILARGWRQLARFDDERRAVLTGQGAPQRVAAHIRDAGVNTVEGLRDWGLHAHEGGRFVELVRQFVFLDRLRQLEIGANDPVLDELRDPVVYEAPHVRGQTVGHAALSILIDRAETYPGELWRDLVIDIAGDPRLTHTAQHRKWWPVLGPAAQERVIGWLARADLHAFLTLLTDFAQEDVAMKRMLSARRRMLEGLLDEGMVRRTRLFLGEEVRAYVRRHGAADRRWDSALLKQQREKALLYLDCGHFHLIEGSHNTKLWVYLSRPGDRIIAPQEKVFSYQELTSDLADVYEVRRRKELGDEYPGPWHKGIVHNGMWQRNLIEFLGEHRIRLNPEAILEPGDYRRYRHTYGLMPSVRGTSEVIT